MLQGRLYTLPEDGKCYTESLTDPMNSPCIAREFVSIKYFYRVFLHELEWLQRERTIYVTHTVQNTLSG